MSGLNGLTPERILDACKDTASAQRPNYAIVAGIKNDGLLLRLEGESQAGGKRYKRLGSYTPAVGDRVFVQWSSGSGIVLGKVE